MDNAFVQSLVNQALDIGQNLIGAVLLWIIGRWLIKLVMRAIGKGLKKSKIDSTLFKYITSVIGVTLQAILIISILGLFGVQTTSFAALFAAAGVAIGAAWSGLLSNFAAGVFLVLFRPFQVGDVIAAAGVKGTVKEIGIFATTIDTFDNVRTIIGNNKLFADNIQNFSANPYRRVDLTAQISYKADSKAAIALIKEKLSQIPNILNEPSPIVDLLEFNLNGSVLAVRPFCKNENYGQVFFDTNRKIRESLDEAGFAAPEPYYVLTDKA
jgi:small conductance mechanosensitive channel